jgi:hypothetical protein
MILSTGYPILIGIQDGFDAPTKDKPKGDF